MLIRDKSLTLFLKYLKQSPKNSNLITHSVGISFNVLHVSSLWGHPRMENSWPPVIFHFSVVWNQLSERVFFHLFQVFFWFLKHCLNSLHPNFLKHNNSMISPFPKVLWSVWSKSPLYIIFYFPVYFEASWFHLHHRQAQSSTVVSCASCLNIERHLTVLAYVLCN